MMVGQKIHYYYLRLKVNGEWKFVAHRRIERSALVVETIGIESTDEEYVKAEVERLNNEQELRENRPSPR